MSVLCQCFKNYFFFFVSWTLVWRGKKLGRVFSCISHTLLLDTYKYLIHHIDISCVFFQLTNSENVIFGSSFQIHLKDNVFLVAIKEHIPFLKTVQETVVLKEQSLSLLFPYWKLGLSLKWTQKSLVKEEEEGKWKRPFSRYTKRENFGRGDENVFRSKHSLPAFLSPGKCSVPR